MKSIPFYPLMVLLLVGLGGYLGCDPNSIEIPNGVSSTSSVTPGTASGTLQLTTSVPARTQSTILVGSFNMERLGPSKLNEPWILEKFASIIRQFDVIALQEITSKDQRTLPYLVEQLNATGGTYSYTISPRIGREATGYFEQYAYVYDTTRIVSSADSSYVVADPADVLHREPYVGHFQTITNSGQPYRFVLINIHTDPDEISHELNVLADVYKNVRQFEYPEDDVILLGDINASPTQLLGLGQIPDLMPVITQMPTNTRKNKALDNFLIDRVGTREYTGRSGTLDMERAFQIKMQDAERISDHMPIWAEFSIVEQSNTVTSMAGAKPDSVLR